MYALPGGTAAIYYAHQLIKFVSNGKYKEEDDGFDGFKVRCELMKSRTNKAGQSCSLIYDQNEGFDPIRTQLEFADENKLLDGRNPNKYIKGYETMKFNMKKIDKSFEKNPELVNAVFESTIPLMEKGLYCRDEGSEDIKYTDVLDRLLASQENEEEE